MEFTKEQKREAARVLKILAYSLHQSYKGVLNKNLKEGFLGYREIEEFKNSWGGKQLIGMVQVWKDLASGPDSKIITAATAEHTRKNLYCGHQHSFTNQTCKLSTFFSQKNFYFVFNGEAEKLEELFYCELGYSLGAKSGRLEKSIKLALEGLDEYQIETFEKWNSKKRPSKKTKVKEKCQTKKSEVNVKGFCCSVMGTIRDFMIKKGIEDYKNATCELGTTRKAAVRSLMCYSKTQEAKKVENFKNLVSKGFYSEQFKNWPELMEEVRELEQTFTR